ncbi:hypothetical protein V495_01387 [Pseudogymnoascus sp. VKM F-4514 (FW-929)]|nr:hypothetical protein V495_01387 [Pseudogymnoascus sp. VKM F-4514 (FW-929)]
MAQNPYAGFNASADPYTAGDTLAASSPNPSRDRSPGATSTNTDDYDPYGDRYGTPPLGTPPLPRRLIAQPVPRPKPGCYLNKHR